MQLRQAYLKRFAQILNRLNPAQRQAVEQIEGPVLTIAGPGTGKTHILTARVGQILIKTDTQAHNILCLTFTDAGVQAMRQRLLEFIGPEAHRVHIYTFHSFCNKIIQDNLDRFGRYDLRPLADLERVEVVRRLLEQLPLDHVLRGSSDLYFYERPLQDLFQRMKSERWTPEYIQEQIKIYLADLLHRPEFRYQRNNRYGKAGDLRKEQYEEQVRRMERLLAAAALFPAYQAELQARHRYDYDDMILWVLDLFEQDEFILRIYQEQYLYVLVDEFQDSNGAQNELIHQLIAYWEDNPNVFIVGDDDQSIFEFQGARLRHISEFYERYRKHLSVILLRENYRSAPSILRAAERLITENENRLLRGRGKSNLPTSKVLKSVNPQVKNLRSSVRIKAWPNRAQEEAGLILQIKALKSKGVSLNDIAVLYAQHKQAQGLIRLLEQEQLPYRSRRRINVLEQPLILQIRRLLQYVVEEYLAPGSAEELLYEILHQPYFELHPSDLRLLSWEQAKLRRPWYEALNDAAWLDGLALKKRPKLDALLSFLDRLRRDFKQEGLARLLEICFSQSGMLAHLQKRPDKAWQLELLSTFFEFAQEESRKNPYLSLREFLDMLQRMESNAIALGVYRSTYAEEGINLLTAHSAKGLEFDYVFMIHCMEENWEPSGNRARRFPLPDTLTQSFDTDETEAARRLFYVGMTRAKRALQLSYHAQNEEEKTLKRTRFLDELQAAGNYPTQEAQLKPQQMTKHQLQQLQHPALPLSQKLEEARVAELLGEFKMTVSALNTYLTCPLSFYYEYVLRLPSNPSKEAAYGIALHNILKRLFDAAQRKMPPALPAESEALNLFEQEMERQRPFFEPRLFKQFLDQGRRHLPAYLEQRREEWEAQLSHQQILSEKSLRQIEIDGIPVLGIIDKLQLQAPAGQLPHWKIVDYKTGKADPGRLEAPTPKRPEGGYYYRQLLFYKLLVEHAPPFNRYPVKSVEIDYLFPDKDGIFDRKELAVTHHDSHWMRQLLRDTYQKIKNKEFTQGCGKSSCKWCGLATRQNQAEDYRNEVREAMDDY